MKANLLITKRLTVLAFSIISLQLPVSAQGTAFSYQGRLDDNGSPANGTYDLRFAIYDAGTNGSLIGGPDTNSATGVTNGLFCVTLDFGNGVFEGSARWLEIAARTNGAAEFTALAPRQAVMPVPYALYAPSAGSAAGVSGGVSASQITGTLALAQLPGAVLTNGEQDVSLTGSLTGNLIGNATTAGTASSTAAIIASDGTQVLTLTGTNYTGLNTNTIYFTSGVALGVFGSAQVFQWSTSIAAYTNGSGAGEYYELTQARWQITNSINPDTNSPFIYPNNATNPVSINWHTNDGTGLAGVFPSFGTNTVLVYSLGNAVVLNSTAPAAALAGVASNTLAFSQDLTNLDNTTWMYEKADCLEDNQNVGRYAWTNAIAKLRAGKTIRIEFDGTGLTSFLFPPFGRQLTNTFGVPAGVFNDMLNGGGFVWPQWGNIIFNYTGAAYSTPGLDGFWFTGYAVTTNAPATIGIYGNPAWSAMPFAWDVLEIDYCKFPNGSSFKVQTNNNANGAFGDISGTISTVGAGTNGASWFWTNSAGPQQLGYQVVSLSTGTNIFLSMGNWNSTITNGFIIGWQTHDGSHVFEENAAVTNNTGPLYQTWNPDLILWESIESVYILTNNNSLANWVNFYKTWVPSAGVVLCGTYPSSNADQAQQGTVTRNIALQSGVSYFDGYTPFESTNTMILRGMWGDGVHNYGAYPLYAYWLYRWLDLQDFYLQGGLTDANIITGGITTNIVVGGHTFYYTNGVLVNIQ